MDKSKTELYVAIVSEIFYRWNYDKQDYCPFDVDCFREYCHHYDWQSAWDDLTDRTEEFNKAERHSPQKKQFGFLERHILDVYKL